MKITEIIWKEKYAEKLEALHQVSTDEAEEIICGTIFFSKMEKGRVKGEDVYRARGQTEDGRLLVVYFILKKRRNAALPISAREMDDKERRRYKRE